MRHHPARPRSSPSSTRLLEKNRASRRSETRSPSRPRIQPRLQLQAYRSAENCRRSLNGLRNSFSIHCTLSCTSIKNSPSRIICSSPSASPSQMLNRSPTTSICVEDFHFAPVCARTDRQTRYAPPETSHPAEYSRSPAPPRYSSRSQTPPPGPSSHPYACTPRSPPPASYSLRSPVTIRFPQYGSSAAAPSAIHTPYRESRPPPHPPQTPRSPPPAP